MERPDDVLDLSAKAGSIRALEAADPMWLEAVCVPDARDRS